MTQNNNPSNGPIDPKEAAAIRARRKAMKAANTTMMEGGDRRDTSQYDHGATADVDLNELRAARQTGWDKIGNGSVKMLNTGVGSILEGLGVIGGAGVAAGAELIQRTTGYGDGWDSDTVFKNPFVEYIADLQNTVREMVPHYASAEEEHLTALQRLGTANFWTDTMAEAAGFAAGAMFQAGMVSKIGKGFLMANMAARSGNINLLTKLVGSTEMAAAYRKVATGTSLFAGAMTGRVGESAIEANGTYDKVYQDALDRGLSEGQAEALARDARTSTFGWNMMLAVPDMFQYAKIFGTFKKTNDMIRRTKMLADGSAEMAKRGLTKKMFSYAAPVVGNMVLESQEENYQLGVSNMAEGIASGKYDEDAVKSWQGVTGAIMSEMVGNFFTKEGQESMLAGAILGGGMVGPTTVMNEHQKTKHTLQAIQTHNEVIKKQQQNVLTFASLENAKNAAAERGDRLMYDTAQQTQFNDWVRAKIEIGRFDDLVTELEAWGNEDSLSEDELNSLGEKKNPRYYANKAIKEAKRLQDIYQSVENAFPDLAPQGKHFLYHNLSLQNFMDKKLAKLNLDAAQVEAAKSAADINGTPFQASLLQASVIKDRDSLIKAKAVLVQEYQDMLDPARREERVKALTKKEEAKKEEAPKAEEEVVEEELPEGNLESLEEDEIEEPPVKKQASSFMQAAGGNTGAPVNENSSNVQPGEQPGAEQTDEKLSKEDYDARRNEAVDIIRELEEQLKEDIDTENLTIEDVEGEIKEKRELLEEVREATKAHPDLGRLLDTIENLLGKLEDKAHQAFKGEKSPATRAKEELMNIRGLLARVKGKLKFLNAQEIEDEMIPIGERIKKYQDEFGASQDLNVIKKDYNEIREAYKLKLQQEAAKKQKEEEAASRDLDPNFYSKVQTAYMERDDPKAWQSLQGFNAAIKMGYSPESVWVVNENGGQFNVYAEFNGTTYKLGYLNKPDLKASEEITKLTDEVNKHALEVIKSVMEIAEANPKAVVPIDVEFLTGLDYTEQSLTPLSELDSRFKDKDGKYHIYRVRKGKNGAPTITNLNTKMPATTAEKNAMAGVKDGYVVRVTDPSGQIRYVGLETAPLETLDEVWEVMETFNDPSSGMDADFAQRQIDKGIVFLATNQSDEIVGTIGSLHAKIRVGSKGLFVQFNQNAPGNPVVGNANLPKGAKPSSPADFISMLKPSKELKEAMDKAGIKTIAELFGNNPMRQQMNESLPVEKLIEKLVPVTSDDLYRGVTANVLGHAGSKETTKDVKNKFPTNLLEVAAEVNEQGEVKVEKGVIREYTTQHGHTIQVLEELEAGIKFRLLDDTGEELSTDVADSAFFTEMLKGANAQEVKEEEVSQETTEEFGLPSGSENVQSFEDGDDIVYKSYEDGQLSSTDWNEVSADIERVLPEGFSLANMRSLSERLKGKGMPIGAFLNKIIYLADKTTKTTHFHEIFHAVFRNLLTKEEIQHYYKLAAEKVDLSASAVEDFINANPLYYGRSESDIRGLMLEEYLADEFEKFIKNERANKKQKKGYFYNLFSKLWSWIKVFKKNNDTIQNLFHKIDKGAFRTATIQENNFNTAVYKALPHATVIESSNIIRTVTAIYAERVFEDTVDSQGKRYSEVYSEMSQKEIIDSIITELKNDDTKPLSLFMMLPKEVQAREAARLKIYRGDASKGEDANLIYKATYDKDRDIIADQVEKTLKYFGFGVITKEDVDLTEDEALIEDDEANATKDISFDVSPFEVGGLGNVSKDIKAFIGLTLYKETGDKLPRAIDTYTTFSQIQRVLAGLETYEDMVNELAKKGRSSKQIKAILDKLALKGPNFQLKFQQAFTMEAVDHLHVDFDKTTGNAKVYSANRKDIGEIQLSNFKKKYEAKLVALGKDTIKTKAREIAGTIAALNDMYANETYDQSLVDIFHEKLAVLGIDVSADFIEDVIKNENNVYTLAPQGLDSKNRRNLFDEISSIINIIADGENPYKNTDEVDLDKVEAGKTKLVAGSSMDAISRIKRLGVEDSKYRRDIINPSFQNAEGKSVFAYSKPSFILTTARNIQEGKLPFDINDDFYSLNPFIKAYKAAMAKGDVAHAEEILSSLKLSAFNGVRERSQTEGVTFKNIDAKTMIVSQHALYRDNKFIPFVIESKSTSFALSVGQLTAATTYEVNEGKGKLSLKPSMVSQLMDFVQQDLNKINRTVAEIKKALETNDFTQLAEGYHFKGSKPTRENLLAVLEAHKEGGDRSKMPRGMQIVQFPDLNPVSEADLKDKAYMKEYFDLFFTDAIDGYLDVLNKNDLSIKNDPKTNTLTAKSANNLRMLIGSDAAKKFAGKATEHSVREYIGEFLVKDYTIANSYAQLMRGDESLYKGDIDITKRAAALLATGSPRISRGKQTINTSLIADDNHYIFKEGMARLSDAETAQIEAINEKLDKKQDITKEEREFLDSVSEVNATDAQGYSSGSNFIEILRDLGKLTPKAEKILQKLAKGEDLTKEERTLANSGELFVANSIKNVYFDGKVYIKTSIIPLFKEFTSQKNPNFDSTMPESDTNPKWVAKPGLEKLHNLREQMDNQSIDEVYHESAFKMWKKSKNFRGQDGMFGAMETQELNKKFWRLQVENPSGKTKVTYGTQILMLIDSEMSDDHIVEYNGESVPLADVRKEYRKLLSDIRASDFTKAEKVVDLIVDGKSMFADKLQEMLQESGADQNTIEFFAQASTLVKGAKGAEIFEHSTDLPNISKKFQQLFLSHFGKSVFNQKAAGAKLSLVTSQGYEVWDKELQTYRPLKMHGFKMDAEGNPTFEYAECVMSEEILVKYGISKEQLESGKVSKEVRDELLTMLGFRIPTQSHHSMIPFKIVGWMPAYYGSVIIAPAEITYLSGADYDIDSLFVLRKEFRTGKDGINVYNIDKTDTELWKDFQEYEFKNNKALKKIYRTKLQNDPAFTSLNNQSKELRKELKEHKELESNLKRDLEIIQGVLDTSSEEDSNVSLEELQEAGLNSLNVIKGDINEVLNLLKQISEMKKKARVSALQALGMPSNFTEFTSPQHSDSKLTNAARYNRILDANFAFMSNYANKESLFTPASMDSIAEIANVVDRYRKTEGSTKLPYNLATNRFNHWLNNAVGKANVGNAANANLISAFLTKHLVPLNTPVSLDGTSYYTYASNYEYDVIIDENDDIMMLDSTTMYEEAMEDGSGYRTIRTDDGRTYYAAYDSEILLQKRRKADSLSTVVSSMTDNAKERHAARLNLTQKNLSEFSNMLALGMGMNRTMLFANQPMMIELTKLMDSLDTHIKTRTESSFDIITTFKQRIEFLMGEENTPDPSEEIPLTAHTLMQGVKNFDSIWEVIRQYSHIPTGKNSKKGHIKPEHLEIFKQQYGVLRTFHLISSISEEFGKVGKVLSLNKGLGVTFEELDKIEEAYDFLTDPENAKYRHIDVINVLSFSSKRVDTNVVRNVGFLKNIQKKLPEYFMQRTDAFGSIVERFTGNNKKAGFGIANDRVPVLKKDLTLFLGVKLIDKYYKDNNIGSVSSLSNLLVDETDNMVNQLNNIVAKYPELEKNQFIAQLVTKTPEKGKFKNPFYRLEYNTRQGSDPTFIEALVDSYVDLTRNPEKEVKQFAANLYRYLLIKDNLGYSNNSFVSLIPASTFSNFSKMLKKVNNLFRSNAKDLQEDQLIPASAEEVFGDHLYDVQREFIIKWYSNPNNRKGVAQYAIGKNDYMKSVVDPKTQYTVTEFDYSSAFGQANEAKMSNLTMPKDGSNYVKVEFRNSVQSSGIKFPEVYSVESVNPETQEKTYSIRVREAKLIYKEVMVKDEATNVWALKKIPVGARYHILPEITWSKYMSLYGLDVQDDAKGIKVIPPSFPKPPQSPTTPGGNKPSGPAPTNEGMDEAEAQRQAAEEAAQAELAREQASTQSSSSTKVDNYEGYWNREQVAKDTNRVYLFGDNTNDRLNTKYVPSSTQAVIRGLPNAIGIDTKKDRGTGASSYFTDADFPQFKAQVDEAISAAKATGKTIVIPADGIGTGKAMLKEKAPKLFLYLKQQLDSLSMNPQELAVQKVVDELIANAEYISLSADGTKYIDSRTGEEYDRVSSIVSPEGIKYKRNKGESMEKFIARLEKEGLTDKEIESAARTASALEIGNGIDGIARDLFNGELKDYKAYSSVIDNVDAFNSLVDGLTNIKDAMLARGEKPYAKDIVVYDKVSKVAGTVDLLTVDNEGNFRIYDFKTMSSNQFENSYAGDTKTIYETTQFGKSNAQKHAEQLSLYRILVANTHGVLAKTIAVIPIQISYDPGDTSTSFAKVLPSKGFTGLPLVGKVALNGAKKQQAPKTDPASKPANSFKSTSGGSMIDLGIQNGHVPDLQKPTDRKKISREAAVDVVNKLKEKFGIDAEIIDNPNEKWAGKYFNGKATINLAYATEDTPFHEFAHPFIKVIKKSNPTLYKNLVSQIQGTDILATVQEKYPELSEEEQFEEAIVQAIGEYSVNPSKQKSGLSHAIKTLLKRISKILQEMLGNADTLIPSELNPDMTLQDLGVFMSMANKVNLGIESFNNGTQMQKLAEKLVSLGRLTIACK